MTATDSMPTIETATDYGDSSIASTFLNTLFAANDCVLIRPIESWTEGGKKRSLVDYKGTCWHSNRPAFHNELPNILKRTEEKLTHVFFGVCPRFGRAKFDKAWQIRVVPVLWADLDGMTSETVEGRVTEAIGRCNAAGLPRPSVIVSSGNGVHCYWKLAEPYLVDDVGDPPAVESEWVEIGGKKMNVEYYTNEYKDRVNLKDRATGRPIYNANPDLSAKAQFTQDMLQGIAASIGGDSTHDLSRVLRVPGTLNRKDQRNGRPPTRCELIESNGATYSIDQFAKFAELSPDRQRRELAKSMPLPTRRKLTPARADKLAQQTAACEIASDRSKADFALCCDAIKGGIDKEDVWAQVQDKSKFKERGREYYDRTWERAENVVRLSILTKVQAEQQQKPTQRDDDDDSPNAGIVYDPQSTKVRWLLNEITTRLAKSGACFNRAGRAVVVRESEVTALADTPSVAAALCSCCEFVLVEMHGENSSQTYQPLPAKYATTWLCDSRQCQMLPEIKIFVRSPVWINTPQGYRLSRPGYDAETGVYYAGPEVVPFDSTDHLDKLLSEFCWRSAADRTNYLATLLTVVLMPRFIGSKPGILLNGNQPGIGKTILAQIISILRCGSTVVTIQYLEREEELEKRVASVVRSGVETLIIDNAKTASTGEINSAVLDRIVTDPVLSFRLLGTSTDIRAENSHILVLTANSTAVCRDLISRLVPVSLHYEGDPTQRGFSLHDPEGYAEEFRFEILAELLGMVRRWIDAGSPLSTERSRFDKRGWGPIIGGILANAGEPDFLANAAEVAEELDPVRGEFAALVEKMAETGMNIEWTPIQMATVAQHENVLSHLLRDGSDKSRATRLGKLTSRFVGGTFRINVPQNGDNVPHNVMLRTVPRRNGRVFTLVEITQ